MWKIVLMQLIIQQCDVFREYKLSPFKFTRDRVFLGQVICLILMQNLFFGDLFKRNALKTFGQVPPRITGIKMHEQNISRKEMIMDLDIVFASNLVVEFKVNIWVTNNNCEILCFQVKGIPAKISDFGFRGMLRVVFKPLVSSS